MAAIDHVDHVVVLMLENRSFDHLLGLLYEDDPEQESRRDFPGVRLGDPAFSNPLDPAQAGSARVPVNGDGEARLSVDPPHSHGSVVEQLGLRALGPPRMDGFVASYARKIEGDERGRPVVHWVRIVGLVVVVLALVAGVLALPAWWPLITGAIGLAIVADGALAWVVRRTSVLPPKPWWLFGLAVLGALVVLVGLSSLIGLVLGYVPRFGVLAVGLALVGGVVIARDRRKVNEPPPITIDQAEQIMRCMRPDKLPALADLARNFALCTRWHCSVPGATWPNRNFAHAGTSDGTVDIEVGFYDNDTIFKRLQDAGASWRIYRHPQGLAQVMAFDWLIEEGQIVNWRLLDDFATDVATDELAAYSFIEPCHDGDESNSQHPGNNDRDRVPSPDGLSDFERGEQLIASIYEALRARPEVFAKTVLVITYDEHGGFYGHVPPPTNAVEPEPLRTGRRSWLPRVIGWFVEQPRSRFRFDVLGPRVPAVIVSPRIPPQWDHHIYDHAAIPRTVRKLFAPTAPKLSDREDRSATFDHLVSLDEPRTDLPNLGRCKAPPTPATPAAPAASARTETPVRDDTFAHQLRALSSMLHDRILTTRAELASPAGVETVPAPAAAPAPSEVETALLFTRYAELAQRAALEG